MKDNATEIYLVRHGQTVSNTQGRIQGHSDSPLSERGTEQVTRLAKRLSDTSVSVIYSSDLGRALATAEILANSLSKPVQKDRRLREVSFGKVEGLTWDEVALKHSILQQAWFQHEAEARLPEGESREEVSMRVMHLLDDLASKYTGERILAVTHGGVLACILASILQIAKGVRPLCSFDNAALNIIQNKNGRWKIKTWNDDWHLQGLN